MESEIIEINNPCYHCYTGVIGECYCCQFVNYPWSGDLYADYKVKIEEIKYQKED